MVFCCIVDFFSTGFSISDQSYDTSGGGSRLPPRPPRPIGSHFDRREVAVWRSGESEVRMPWTVCCLAWPFLVDIKPVLPRGCPSDGKKFGSAPWCPAEFMAVR